MHNNKPTKTKKQKNPKLPAFILLVAFVALGFMVKTAVSSEDFKNKSVLFAASESKKTEPEIKKMDLTSISSQMEAIIAKYPGLQISVSFIDLKTGSDVHLGVKDSYNAASTAKLLTAVLYLKQVEEGTHSLSESVGGSTAQSQLKIMIENSDNPSWHSLNRILGASALNQYARDIGLTAYSYNTNSTTSADISVLLQKLYNNQLLNSANTQLLLSYMQNASESQYIPAAIPDNMKVYHKAGYLTDRAHDAAIVDNGARPFVLVIFTKSASGGYNFSLGQKIMHDISNVALAEQQKVSTD